jgi:hypothetical protein
MDSIVMFKNRLAIIFLVSCLPVLAACSSINSGSSQQVVFKTEGVEGAFCDVKLGENGLRYNIHPPQTIWVQKVSDPMFISCRANGNRVSNKTVESSVRPSTYWNVLNLGLGAFYDAESGASYRYPDEVVIDFAGTVANDQPLPMYHTKGSLDPSAQGIEYLGPDSPGVPQDKAVADRYRLAYEESARLEAEEAAMEIERQRRIDSVDGGFNGDKGNPVTTDTKPVSENVQVSPLSKLKLPEKNDAPQVPPETSPKLAKPIFQSSTSF